MPCSPINFANVDWSAVAAGLSAVAAIASAVAAFRIPLSAARLSSDMQAKADERERKTDLVRRFAANKSDPPSEQFTSVLNEIAIVFNSSQDVMSAFRIFDASIHRRVGDSNVALLNLIKAMMADLRMNYEGDDALLMRFYTST